jgi:hypothetical protein
MNGIDSPDTSNRSTSYIQACPRKIIHSLACLLCFHFLHVCIVLPLVHRWQEFLGLARRPVGRLLRVLFLFQLLTPSFVELGLFVIFQSLGVDKVLRGFDAIELSPARQIVVEVGDQSVGYWNARLGRQLNLVLNLVNVLVTTIQPELSLVFLLF